MRTSETLLLDFIRQSPQFRIPVNQRRYAWTKRHCRQLWDDILDAGERQDVREHFLGPIMYVAAVDPLNAHWAPCLVYDGQQRLSTVTLILKVLSRHLKDDTAPDGFGPDQIGSEYLVNPFGKGDQHYRLVLKPGDAETLLALVHDRPLPAEPSSRIMDALAFFETRIKQLGPDVSALCAGLRKLRIVAFQLKEGEDNPHRIFETMNTCGRDLTCADMIGNFIRLCCKLGEGAMRDQGASCSPYDSALARRSCSHAMASVRAHGPRPKARSTIRASPTMPPWRANIPAWPLRSARITSKPLIVA